MTYRLGEIDLSGSFALEEVGAGERATKTRDIQNVVFSLLDKARGPQADASMQHFPFSSFTSI
jgi:hypothetical protein